MTVHRKKTRQADKGIMYDAVMYDALLIREQYVYVPHQRQRFLVFFKK